MIWPDGSGFYSPRYRSEFAVLKTGIRFRTKYDYDLLYIVAGEVIHKVSGKAGAILSRSHHETFRMNNSAASIAIKDSTNIIAPHVPYERKAKSS
jgi:hypothetical protein